MKKIIIFLLIGILMSSCSNIKSTDIEPPFENTKEIEKEEKILINPAGTTLKTRILTPEGYERTDESNESLTSFLRNYEMKEHSSPVLLYDGTEKWNQNAHAAVFKLPLEDEDLQQCADSIMRVFAEFYWHKGQHEKIAFHFTNGFLCEYSKWKEGYRVSVTDGGAHLKKSASYDDSYEAFVKYMRIVASYAGTSSMEAFESETISLSDLNTGDVILKGGSPGHVVMVADICLNSDGKKAFLLAQGYMPAQEFHILLNPAHEDDNPWYFEEDLKFPLHTPEYTFDNENMIKRLKY